MSIEPRRHGPAAPITTSSISTKSIRAVTSRHGSNLNSSVPSYERRSDHFGRHTDQSFLDEGRQEVNMKTTRILAAAAMIAAGALATHVTLAQAPGIKRT